MEPAISLPFSARGRTFLRIVLFFAIVGGGLLLQHLFQQHAGMKAFRLHSAQDADLLRDQIITTPANGAVRSLGICNLRLKSIVGGSLPEDCPSLLESLTQLRNRLGADIVYAMNPEGRVVISTRRDDSSSLTGYNYAFRPYFRQAIAGNPTVYPALGSTTFQRGVYYSAPVYGERQEPDGGGPVIGVIVIKMPFTNIDNLFRNSADITCLASPHGIVLASSVEDWQLQTIEMLRRNPDLAAAGLTNPEYQSEFFRSRSHSLPLQFRHDRVRWQDKNYAVRTYRVPMNDPSGDWTVLLLRDTAAWYPSGQTYLNLLVLLSLCLAITIATQARQRHRRAEAAKIKAISDSAKTYLSIFNSVADALFVHDAQTGGILDANDSAKKLYGYTGTDLQALTPEGEFPYPGSVALPALQAAMNKRTQIITFNAQSRSGRVFWAQATFRVYAIQGEVRILANVHDITEQRAAHNALTATKEQLEQEVETRTSQLLQAQKMAAIGKVAERVTHDVTNIMTRIIGYADMARQNAGDAAILDTSLKEIRTGAYEMCEFSTELLAFARPVPLKLCAMNLCRVVEGFESFIRASAPPTVEILFHIPKIRLRVNLSPNHIEQVLAHLALNSFESMVNRGTLTISLRQGQREDDPPASGDAHLPPEKMALIEVTDTGPGFAPEHLPHVFDPFFTTKTDTKRRGMGLTTVYIIVNSHHGLVNVLPASSGGGHVQIWLPLIDDELDP